MDLDFNKTGGLIPGVVQDAATGRVLMVGFLNEDSWRQSLATGNVVFYSRSRNKLWMKGESSGHTLSIRRIQTDCDQDCVLFLVDARGPGVCHEGYQSCFFRTWENDAWQITETPTYNPKAVYGDK